ncbi:MAG TPA: alpha/beta hydrolase [Chthonomonadales bacterium]|nr:alpha/beta hydrolase [Chthonomonadales bacterium]
MKGLGLLAALLAVGAPALGQDGDAPRDAVVEGAWMGQLRAGATQVRMVFHIVRQPAGLLGATLDVPEQGARAIPVETASFDPPALTLNVRVIGASFEGRLSADRTRIVGTWRQGGGTYALTLVRTENPPDVRRPQEPRLPLPYTQKDVTVENAAAAVRLAGTLTVPSGPGPHPAVILISGSGPQDRDQTVFGHRPFLVLADHLTRQGIAVLRLDDRGVGGSTGSTRTATTKDFADDVKCAVDVLKARPEIDASRIGLLGHSEGGIVAPIVAAARADIAFIVLLAGTGLPGEQILYLQAAAIARAGGAPESAIATSRRINERIYAEARSDAPATEVATRVRAVLQQTVDSMTAAERAALGPSVDTWIDVQVNTVTSPWFRHFLSYDPRPALRAVRCPVLVLIGERDLQVPARENAAEIEAALKAGGGADATVRIVPGVNHLFQTAATGLPTEYGVIEETMSPSVLTMVSEWILARARRSRPAGR